MAFKFHVYLEIYIFLNVIYTKVAVNSLQKTDNLKVTIYYNFLQAIGTDQQEYQPQ